MQTEKSYIVRNIGPLGLNSQITSAGMLTIGEWRHYDGGYGAN